MDLHESEATGSGSLAIVIPCYNEETRLPSQEILDWAERRTDWKWLLVDDGSRDGTRGVIESLMTQNANIEGYFLEANQGKAEAVRLGLLQAESRFQSPWLCYLDADLATGPGEIERMFDLYRESQMLVVMGCRLKRLGVQIHRSLLRHYIGRAGATLISMLLALPTYDTQCGAKLLQASTLPVVLAEPFCSRWLFDVEILARFRNHYGSPACLQRVMEEPLRAWQDKAGSKLRIKDFLLIPGELWRLHQRYNR